MTYTMLDPFADCDRWDELFARLPAGRRDVHFSSAYARVQWAAHHRTAAVLSYDNSTFDGFVLQPIRIADAPLGFADITSPYGFGGPMICGEVSLRTINVHAAAMADVAIKCSFVSEYCTLHPLYGPLQAQLVTERIEWFKKSVVMDLTRDLPVSRRVKRGVKKATEAGWRVHERNEMFVNAPRCDAVAHIFGAMYDCAMSRKNAAARWRFPREYWVAHWREQVGARWFSAENGLACARSLLTIGVGDNAYAHFLGSNGDRHDGLDELLYWEASQRLRAAGVKNFHLGGGLTNDLSDSLLMFKAGFSPYHYQVGRYERIFNRGHYDTLMAYKRAEEIAKHGRESTCDWFPEYRREFI